MKIFCKTEGAIKRALPSGHRFMEKAVSAGVRRIRANLTG